MSKWFAVMTLVILMVAAALPAAAAGHRVDVVVVLADSLPAQEAQARAAQIETAQIEAAQIEAAQIEIAQAHGLEVAHTYRHALNGFAGSIAQGQLNALVRDPRVAFVEPDVEVSIAAQTLPTGVQRVEASTNSLIDIDGTDDVRIDVDVAVLDTGIDAGHPDLSVVAQTDCAIRGPFNTSCRNGSAADGDGHGTHVAGTVAAIDNDLGVVGVAPGARLHAVKVLDDSGSGYLSWIIAGIDWVTARADTIEVANMSLGFQGTSDALDSAISRSVAAGVTYAVAAGNDAMDARNFSPASNPDVITVSALADFDGQPGALGQSTCRPDEDDTLANFSNYGPAVEIAGPGVCILSTVPGGGYATYSGTSMASPHVAGGAAVLLASNPSLSPDQVRSTLIGEGTVDWTDEVDGVTEPRLDVGDETVFAPATVSGGGSTSGDVDGGTCNPGQSRKGQC